MASLPAKPSRRFIEGETTADEAEGVTSLRREFEVAVYKVTSGVYDFSVKVEA